MLAASAAVVIIISAAAASPAGWHTCRAISASSHFSALGGKLIAITPLPAASTTPRLSAARGYRIGSRGQAGELENFHRGGVSLRGRGGWR